MKIDGGFHCGYITYEAEADPAHVFGRYWGTSRRSGKGGSCCKKSLSSPFGWWL